jgi:hypothetical protein
MKSKLSKHAAAIRRIRILITLSACVLASACTTAMYGQSLVQDQQIPDQYSFKVYVGGFSGPGTADNRAREEIAAFMAKEKYSSYQIVDRRYNLFPLSYYEYKVRFSRKGSTG